MNKYLVFLLALTVNFAFSQAGMNLPGDAYGGSSAVFTDGGSWVKNSPKNSDIKGTPYLFDTWNSNNALIYSADNRAYKFHNLNYNVQLERFESQYSNDSILAFNPKNIDRVVINNMVFKRYLDSEYQRNSYFEELVVTKSFTILRKYEISIKEGVVNPLTHQKTTDDEMVVKEKYFYTTDSEKLELIQLKKGSILKALDSDKRDIIKEYAKENNLSFKDINDLKKILEYYNTL